MIHYIIGAEENWRVLCTFSKPEDQKTRKMELVSCKHCKDLLVGAFDPDGPPVLKPFPPLPTGGIKEDDQKLRYDLIQPKPIEGLAKVLGFGAGKYFDRNWEKGLAFRRVYGALQRHMQAFMMGEDLDPETNLPHLDHAAANIHFLQHMFHDPFYAQFDDRYWPDAEPKRAPVSVIHSVPYNGAVALCGRNVGNDLTLNFSSNPKQVTCLACKGQDK